ncbi:hypothetical protein Tco_1119307 [Tanacetum coccineum]
MASVIKNDFMVLPYGMLLTRLYMHVHTTQPIDISDIHFLTNHVMVPLIEGRTHRIMVDGEVDPVDNYTLDPVVYMHQLLPILEGESAYFKKAKGLFKCFSHFLPNLEKKKK